jgi:hypothetical protein
VRDGGERYNNGAPLFKSSWRRRRGVGEGGRCVRHAWAIGMKYLYVFSLRQTGGAHFSRRKGQPRGTILPGGSRWHIFVLYGSWWLVGGWVGGCDLLLLASHHHPSWIDDGSIF